jgi:Xaa-Pro aminopeptidase
MRQRTDLAFPMEEYERRLNELRVRMGERGIDAMMTTTPENICYLSGFESVGHYYFNALVIPLEEEPFMVPRFLEDSGVQYYTWIEVSRPYKDDEDPMDALHKALAEFGLLEKRIGFEKGCWFFTAVQQERLFKKSPKTEYVDQSGIVEEGRLIKSEYEIEMMRRAALTTQAGMRAGIDAVKVRATENDIAAEIHYAMIKAGSEWPSISPFVASGPRGAVGHATWAGRIIQPDEFVFLEIAGALKRYHAPMMRTVSTGEMSAKMFAGQKIVLEAFDAAVDLIKPGVPAGDVDALTRRIIGESDFGAEQASRTAYSVGIGLPPDWGEGQILSMQPGETRPLRANMTFHLLPWVQFPGKGAIGITETIRVTDDGCEILTDFERKLFVNN